MAIVLLEGRRVTDDNGAVVSGGKLYVFEAGTSNPRDVYTDSALTTAHAHPIVADAGGLLPDIYSAQDELKLRVTDASDNTIWEIDNYTAGASSSSSGDVTRTPLSKTANYTVQAEDENSIIVMDASGIGGLQGDVTADAATLGAGFVIGVKNIGATGNTLFQGTGAQTVDGASNRLLTTQYEFMDLVSRGAAGWFVLASQGASDVSVTVQQADASTNGELNFEDNLGNKRWVLNHEHTTDTWKLDRYNSSGAFVETVLEIDDANGEITFTNDTYFTADIFKTSATNAIGSVNRIVYTAGSGTWTKPTGLKALMVRGAGPGRSGGNGGFGGSDPPGAGGASGASGEKLFAASALAATEAYVVGGANTSTDTTFDTLTFEAGENSSSTIPAATGADVNVAGTPRDDITNNGGNTIFGPGGRYDDTGNGNPGTAPGTGGAGGEGSGAGGNGGAGQDGILILDEYF